jgi:hypothetical protein
MLTYIDYIDYPPPPDLGLTRNYVHPSVSDLLSSTGTNIDRLSKKGILKSGLYSYVLGLIKKYINTDPNIWHTDPNVWHPLNIAT